jgi:translation initiation factor IF-1
MSSRNSRGGSNHRKGSKRDRHTKSIDILDPEGTAKVAVVEKKNGTNQLIVLIKESGAKEIVTFGGKFKKRVWFNPGDFVYVKDGEVIQKISSTDRSATYGESDYMDLPSEHGVESSIGAGASDSTNTKNLDGSDEKNNDTIDDLMNVENNISQNPNKMAANSLKTKKERAMENRIKGKEQTIRRNDSRNKQHIYDFGEAEKTISVVHSTRHLYPVAESANSDDDSESSDKSIDIDAI